MSEFAIAHFVKICGITTVDDARGVIDAGADALGLVLTTSTRQVSVERAREIARACAGEIRRVAVFRHDDDATILEAAATVGVDAVQIHGPLSPDLSRELRARGTWIVKALAEASAEIDDFDEEMADALLLDGPVPGSGRTHSFDSLTRRRFSRPIIVAGGLTPANVAEVLAATDAWGADVASGVESAPGVKDLALVRDFVGNAVAFFRQREEKRD